MARTFKEHIESMTNFFYDYSYFRNNFHSLWNKLKLEIAGSNPTEEVCILNLDGHSKALSHFSELTLPFDNETNTMIKSTDLDPHRKARSTLRHQRLN